MALMSLARAAWSRAGFHGLWTVGRYYAYRMRSAVPGRSRSCPACGWTGAAFHPFLVVEYSAVRPAARCPQCGALERHRAYSLFYEPYIAAQFPQPPDIIHFAPEAALEPILRKVARRYWKSSYPVAGAGELCLDLRDLALADESCDMIVLNFVLSCMPEVDRAVASMYRVLRPGGIVLAGESVDAGRPTLEVSGITYGGRHRWFGSEDLADRFRPFELSLVEVTGRLGVGDRLRFGISDEEMVIRLRKPDA